MALYWKYLLWNMGMFFLFFLLGMLHRPIKTYKETRRKKFRRLAQRVLDSQQSFPIEPLSEEQKKLLLKRFHDQKTAMWIYLIILWMYSILFDVSVWKIVGSHYYLIIVPLKLLLTAVFIWSTIKKYKRAEEEMEHLGRLRARVVGRYMIRTTFRRYSNKGLRLHFVVSAYMDEKYELRCYDRLKKIGDRNNDFAGYIDVLMYRGKFAGYGISEYIR